MLREFFSFFFFQAEDGIRDYKVTGVQTCALPICREDLFRNGASCTAPMPTRRIASTSGPLRRAGPRDTPRPKSRLAAWIRMSFHPKQWRPEQWRAYTSSAKLLTLRASWAGSIFNGPGRRVLWRVNTHERLRMQTRREAQAR